MNIRYTSSLTDITPQQLTGFFVGWPHPPAPERHLQILANSSHVLLAVEEESGRVVGFINAVSDGIHCAHIPLLEVLPAWQGRDIGRNLVTRLLAELSQLYAIDLTCDPPLQAFYARCGMQPSTGMMVRNFDRQNAEPPPADDPANAAGENHG